MADAKRLVDAMRKAGMTPENERTDIVFGIVQSMSPLTVKTDRLTLTEEFLIRSPFTYDNAHAWKGIKAGDKVIMLKCGKGQKYYILHKVPWDAS